MSAFKLTLGGKAFRINLQDIHEKMQADYPNKYHGFAVAMNDEGHSLNIKLSFDVRPTGQEIAAIQTYVNGIDSGSSEALRGKSLEDIESALKSKRSEISLKAWDDLSAPERLLAMGDASDLTGLGILPPKS